MFSLVCYPSIGSTALEKLCFMEEALVVSQPAPFIVLDAVFNLSSSQYSSSSLEKPFKLPRSLLLESSSLQVDLFLMIRCWSLVLIVGGGLEMVLFCKRGIRGDRSP